MSDTKPDLRALIQDRRAKDARPTVKHPICLDPDLLDQLTDLRAEKTARDDDETADQRMVDKLGRDIKTLEAKVAEVSVVALFRTPKRERIAELEKIIRDESDERDFDLELVQECFWKFDTAELNAADFENLLPLLARGEVNTVASLIWSRAVGRPDFPKSVQQSLMTRK